MDKSVIIALVFFAVLGGVLGFLLALFDKKMKTAEDPRIAKIAELLPGANCGGCGFAGCSGLAGSIVEGGATMGGCAALTADNAAKIGHIMGVAPTSGQKMRAVVLCAGAKSCSTQKYLYSGVDDCVAAAKLHGGSRLCPQGCIGLGTCVRSCKFGALKVVDGVAVVDGSKCTGCGACVAGCPKNLIKLVPAASNYAITCSSLDRGPVVKMYCDAGCLACGLCAKSCTYGAIVKEGFTYRIDYSKCVGCGDCVQRCPRKIIRHINAGL